MGTTDSTTALDVLRALSRAGVGWAMLHGTDRLMSRGPLSDIDIAVEPVTASKYSEFMYELRDASLAPLIVWPYDRTGTSTFVVRDDLTGGVQLDMLIDPDGRGAYGFRTAPAIADAEDVSGIPALTVIDTFLYSVCKRQVKQQHDRLQLLLQSPPATPQVLKQRSAGLFHGAHYGAVCALLEGRTPLAGAPRFNLDIGRLTKRAMSPSGAWIHLTGGSAAVASEELERRLQPILPHLRMVDTDHLSAAHRIPYVGPHPEVRWRAGMVLSHGGGGRGATVQLRADGDDHNTTARSLTSSLSTRAEEHLARRLVRRAP